MSIRPLPLLLLLCAGICRAGTLEVRINDGKGAAVADAVLTLSPLDNTGNGIKPAPEVRQIDQRDERFVPYVEVFKPGDQVVFHNSDGTQHHAYSFAPEATFEMVLKPGEASQPITLPNSGTIAVGCNIHDNMITYLVVSEAPWFGRSSEDGHWRVDDLPAGRYRLTAWHPQIRPAGKPLVREIDAGDGTSKIELTLELGPDPRGEHDRERLDY